LKKELVTGVPLNCILRDSELVLNLTFIPGEADHLITGVELIFS